MGALGTYRLRLERKRRLVRSLRKSRELNRVANRTGDIADDDILIFSTVRNERIRLPFFLDYYRKLGVNHFLFVDNGSDDGTREYLESQADVSLWTISHSHQRATSVVFGKSLSATVALRAWASSVGSCCRLSIQSR